MVNLIKEHRPIIQLGAGALFIDRYTDNGNIRGAEMYIGDTVAASISATVERTTVYSGDGAVASKLIDRVRRIDRAMSITVQDATLGRDALFMMADRPGREEAGNPDEQLITVIRVPEHVSDRTHFQLGSGEMGTTPAGRPAFDLGATPLAGGGFMQRTLTATSGAFRPFSPAVQAADFSLDAGSGRIRFTKSGIAKVKGKQVRITIAAAKITALPAFERVSVGAEVSQVRIALRYIEDADPGMAGRNIYVPRATLSPAGEAALKSRDEPQQFPLQLAIETPDDGLRQTYIDGVPE